jgi:Flp pilus assembly protein TadD/2-polyprenyl-3-methyl-5-hydroxy-6-metoxy-1,4-benzoquinol methylase
MNRKDRRAAESANRGARASLTASPEGVGQLLAIALDHHRAGRLPEAEAHYRRILVTAPDHSAALHYLGVLAHQVGRNDAAIELIERAIRIDGNVPDFHYNLGIVFEAMGRHDDAVAQYRTVTRLHPAHAGAFQNLGNVLLNQGQLDEAEIVCRRAATLNPQSPDAHYNLGLVLARLERYVEARGIFQTVQRLRPDFAAVHGSLGAIFMATGDFEQAAPHCRRALEIDPRNPSIMINLALIHVALGDLRQALEFALDAIAIEETAQARAVFVRCARHARVTVDDARFRDLICRSLSEGWDRPSNLMLPAISLIRTNGSLQAAIERQAAAAPRRLSIDELCRPSELADIANDRLFAQVLRAVPVCDPEVERVLVDLRRGALDQATEAQCTAVAEDVLSFLRALAQQCFINEYVFPETDEERRQVASLGDRLDAALRAGDDVPLHWIPALASYVPIDKLGWADVLVDRAWPAPVAAIVQQQIIEPRAEREIRATLPRLTTVGDRVSRDVRQQYEQNPYPRWITARRGAAPTTVDAHMAGQFPRAGFTPLGRNAIDILIAGCGTGQHSIEVAERYPDADVLAIDLSITSLGYAARKSREIGLANIRYGIADILKIDQVGRQFDLIEASGVLHHLADPFAAWRRLLAILRPGGIMNVGLYSELGRPDVVRARAFIAEHGFASTPDGIRACRCAMMARPDDPLLADVCLRGDFYSMSGCRDLLFHVEEHRQTLPQIAAFLGENRLTLLGFETEGTILAQYKARFPADTSQTDLASWQQFEIENPRSFAGMYQFWVQKP